VKAMNVNISTEVTEITVIKNDNAHVTVTNGKITALKVHRTSVIGALEFEHFGEFEGFVRNVLDVYHSVLLEKIQ
jgi:hypothetical protein